MATKGTKTTKPNGSGEVKGCIHPRHAGGTIPAAKTRGLCNNCYHQVLQLVKKGKVTMAQLEAAGKVLPPAKSASAIAAWFTEGVAPSGETSATIA
jgi:hypothetical protein